MQNDRKFNLKFYFNTRRELFYAIDLVILSLALLLFLIMPQAQLLFTQMHQLESENRTLTTLRKRAINLDNLKTSVTMKNLKVLDRVLPSKKPLLELLTQLNNLSKVNQIKIDVLQVSPGVISSISIDKTKLPKQSRATKDYDSLTLKMTVSGSFDRVQRFISLLEKISPFTTVKSFSLNKKSSLEMAQSDQVSARLTTKTYFFLSNERQIAKGAVIKPTAKDEALLNQLENFRVLNRPIDVSHTGGLEDLFGIKSWQNLKESDINRYLQSQSQPSP